MGEPRRDWLGELKSGCVTLECDRGLRPRSVTELDRYLSGLGLETGWLIIFDRREGQPPISERTTTQAATTPGGRAVTVIRA